MHTQLGFPCPPPQSRPATPPHPSVDATEQLSPGCTIGGQYVLRETIGRGGMGVVFRAEQPMLQRSVAIKFLRPDQHDAWASHRFQIEALTVGKLNHPNTISVIDVGRTAGGTPYLVMEYVHGCTLRELIRRDGVPSRRRAVDIVRQMLDALEDTHRAGIVHADVKSDNVMVAEQRDGADVVKLLDFGLARSAVGDDLDNAVSGTPAYLAPEVILRQRPTPRSDVYSVGIILYEVLTGSVPFMSECSDDVLAMHVNDPPPPLAARCPDRTFSRALQHVVSRALSKDPMDRYPSAAALSDALAEALPRTDDDAAQVLRGAIRAAIRGGEVEEIAARALELDRALVEDLRTLEAIDELEAAIEALTAHPTNPERDGRALWPLLATLARHLDDIGDRLSARRIAAHAGRQAARAGSVYGRDATRALLLHLAMRRG